MVQVPRISSQQVARGAVPGLRVNPRSNREASGLGVATDVSNIINQEKEKADRLAASTALRAAKQQAQSIVWDPESGLAGLDGQQYFQRSGEVPAEYREFLDKQLDGLSPRQREFAQPSLQAEFDAFVGDINRTATQKMNALAHGSLEADVESDIGSSVSRYGAVGGLQRGKGGNLNTSPVDAQVDLITARVTQFAADYPNLIGDVRPEQYVKQRVEDAKSELHSKMIDRMLSNGQEQNASDYLKLYGKDMLTHHVAQANRATQDASNVAVSMKIGKELSATMPILGGDPEDLSKMNKSGSKATYLPPRQQLTARKKEARRKAEAAGYSAKQIEQIVDYVSQRGEDEIRDLKLSQAEVQSELASKLVDADGDMSVLEGRYAQQLRFLDPEQQAQLKTMSSEMQAGADAMVVQGRYANLMSLASADPAGFVRSVTPAQISIELNSQPQLRDALLKVHKELEEGRTGGLLPALKLAEDAATGVGLEYKKDGDNSLRNAYIMELQNAAGGPQALEELGRQPQKMQALINRQSVKFSIERKSAFFRNEDVTRGALAGFSTDELDYAGTRGPLNAEAKLEVDARAELMLRMSNTTERFKSGNKERSGARPRQGEITSESYKRVWLQAFLDLVSEGQIEP